MSLDSNLQSAFTAVGTAIKGKIGSSEKGVANGVATLDGTGKIPSAQLPSYLKVLQSRKLTGRGQAGVTVAERAGFDLQKVLTYLDIQNTTLRYFIE